MISCISRVYFTVYLVAIMILLSFQHCLLGQSRDWQTMAKSGPVFIFICPQAKNVFPFLKGWEKTKEYGNRDHMQPTPGSLYQELDQTKSKQIIKFTLFCPLLPYVKKYRKRQQYNRQITAEFNVYQSGKVQPWQKCNLKNTENFYSLSE